MNGTPARRIRFPDALVSFTPSDGAISMVIEAEYPEMTETMKHVVVMHLDRFAFREAPLKVIWQRTV
jgi:uncharacterized protein